MPGMHEQRMAALERMQREQAGVSVPGLLGEFGLGLLPGAGIADAAGRFPNLTDERAVYPGMNENFAEGNYLTGLLQGLSAAGDASAVAMPLLGAGLINPVLSAPRAIQRATQRPDSTRRRGQTVADPLRQEFPGVYDNPRVIAQEAEALVPPESPNLQRLFGTSREELAALGQTRQGNEPGVLPGARPGSRGASVAPQITGSRNTNRLVDTLAESITNAPQLTEGMTGWYVMDPMYQRMEQLLGPAEAARQYRQLNAMSGMASPGSDVVTEIRRGSAANALANEGRIEDFLRFGGSAAAGRNVPGLLGEVPGHAYHKTHAPPMMNFVEHGEVRMGSPKVPSYIHASGVPETGFQTNLPVGDAHWARAVGLPDVRTGGDFGMSASTPEMISLAPWWRDQVAGQVGLEAVPGQALAWGAFAPRTGVDTAVGVPKLELWADQIARRAERAGVSPETMRDRILTGRDHAGLAGAGVGLTGMGLLGYGVMQAEEEFD